MDKDRLDKSLTGETSEQLTDDDETLSSLKSLEYAEIDKFLNPEATERPKDSTPWWMKSKDDKQTSQTQAKKSTWLKRHAQQKEVNDAKTNAEENNDITESTKQDSEVELEESVDSDRFSSEQTGESLSEVIDYSENFENEETDKSSENEKQIDGEPSLKPKKTKKHVTFLDKDEIYTPDSSASIASPSSESSRSSGFGRIAASFNQLPTPEESVRSAPAVHQLTQTDSREVVDNPNEYLQTIHELTEKLKMQQKESEELLEAERKKHLGEIGSLQNQLEAITEQVLSANVNVDSQQIDALKKEIKDQQTIINGYEKENKRVLSEIKQIKISNGLMNDKLHAKSEDILKENLNIRTQLEQKCIEIRSLKAHNEELAKSKMSGSSRSDHNNETNQLMEIEDLNTRLAKLSEENQRLNSKLTLSVSRHKSSADRNKVQELETQIEQLTVNLMDKDEFYKSKLKQLKADCNGVKKNYEYHRSLLQQKVDGLKQKPDESSVSRSRSMESSPSRVTVSSLLRECSAKDKEISELKNKLNNLPKKTAVSPVSKNKPEPYKISPNKLREKDLDIRKLQDENKILKQKIGELNGKITKLEVTKQAGEMAEESQLNMAVKKLQYQIEVDRENYEAEISTLKADFAQRHSSSAIAKLQNDFDSLQMVIEHYKSIGMESKDLKKQIRSCTDENGRLKQDVERLQKQLVNFKSSQSPKAKQYEELKSKIQYLEMRYAEREIEMKKVMNNIKYDDDASVATWKHKYYLKHQQIAKFKAELDQIMDVMKELQKQGILIPKS